MKPELKESMNTWSPVKSIPETINHELIFSLISEIEELLKDDDIRAKQVFSTFKQTVPAEFEFERMTETEKRINNYSFEEALESLTKIKLKLNM